MTNIDSKVVERIVEAVMSQFHSAASSECTCLGNVPAEVSARHVHLDYEALEHLFGKGYRLTPQRPLGQPGQFLSEERVKLVTEKGEIANVAILGPLREHTQVELSFTDSRLLGISPPLRLSGDLSDAEDVIIVGPKGVYHAKGSVIAAKAHIHMTKQDATRFGVFDGEHVSACFEGIRSVTLNDVIIRVSDTSSLALHIDYDEANAAMFSGSGSATIIKHCSCQNVQSIPVQQALYSENKNKAKALSPLKKRLVTEKDAKDMVLQGMKPTDGDMLTPAARDVFRAAMRGCDRERGSV